jgi:MFS transporter, Spinster family, sphingosine-1-phosphate transporter
MTAPVTPPVDAPVPGARHALTLLVLINLFNYIDRQVLAAVEPQMAKSLFPRSIYPDGHPNEGALMGLLSSAFLVTYMLAAPVFGWMATWMSRWLLIGAGVLIWSLASGASGLATTYLVMFLTRCLVGIGEAVYGPVAPDVISDLYPVKRRGQVLSWFYAAIPFGGAIGYAIGDVIMKRNGPDAQLDDWRMAFYVVVPPGIALAAWCFFMKDPPRGQTEGIATGSRKQKLSDYLFLLRIPSYAFNTIGMTLMVFAIGGMGFWMPRYLDWREVPDFHGVSPRIMFGGLTALTGLAATLIGGWAGDRLRARYPGSYFLVSGVAMLVAFPLLLLTIKLPFPLAWMPLAGFVFCLFFNTGPTNTILANVTHPQLRAPGFAFNILLIHLFGDVVSPPLMGAIRDFSDLNVAFYAVSGTVLLGGLVWLWGARYLEEDTRLAPTRLPPT